jgi:hypothetical protein
MKAKMYEKYYKKGLNHMMFKEVLHLKKPKKDVKIFYLIILVLVIVAALLFRI